MPDQTTKLQAVFSSDADKLIADINTIIAAIGKLNSAAGQVNAVAKNFSSSFASMEFKSPPVITPAATESLTAYAAALNRVKQTGGLAVEVFDKMTKGVDGYSAANYNAAKAVTAAFNNLATLRNLYREHLVATQGLTAGSKDLNNAVQKLGVSSGGGGGGTLAEKAAFAQLRGEIDGTILSLANWIKLNTKASGTYDKLVADMLKASEGIKSVTEPLKEQENTLSKVIDKFKEYLASFAFKTAVGVFVGTLKSGTNEIIKFNQEMKNLQAVAGASVHETMAVSDVLKEIARSPGAIKTISELAAGVTKFAQAGLSVPEAMNAIRASADLAGGSIEKMNTTIDLMSTSLIAFNKKAIESQQVADVWANALNLSKLDVTMLRTALNYIGESASQVGMKLEETAASMMVLSDRGMRASTLGTGLRQVLSKLLDPTEQLATSFRMHGVEMDNLNPKLVGYEEVLKNLSGLLLDTEHKHIDMTKAFEIFQLRGAQAASTLVQAYMSGEYDQALEKLKQIGSAEEMVATQSEGLEAKILNLQGRVALIGVAFGEADLAKMMAGWIDAARAALGWIEKIVSSDFGKLATSISRAVFEKMLLVKVATQLWGVMKASAIYQAAEGFIALAKAQGFAAAASAKLAMVNPVMALFTAISVTLAIAGRFKDKIKETADEAAVTAIQFRELTETISAYQEKLASSIQEGGGEYEQVLQRMVKEQPKVAAQLQEILGVTNLSTVSFQELSAAMDKAAQSNLGESLKSNSEALTFFKDLKDGYQESADSVKLAQDRNDDWLTSIAKSTGILDYFSDSVGKKLGGATKDYNALMNESVSQLTELGTKYGWTREKLEEYVQSMNLSPEVAGQMVNSTMKALDEIARAVPKQAKVFRSVMEQLPEEYQKAYDKMSELDKVSFVKFEKETTQKVIAYETAAKQMNLSEEGRIKGAEAIRAQEHAKYAQEQGLFPKIAGNSNQQMLAMTRMFVTNTIDEHAKGLKTREKMEWEIAGIVGNVQKNAAEGLSKAYSQATGALESQLKSVQAKYEQIKSKITGVDSSIESANKAYYNDIKDLQRQTMSDEQKWNQDRATANEMLAEGVKTQNADMIKDAQAMFKTLSREVKDANGTTVKDVAETQKVATDGIEASHKAAIEALENQKKKLAEDMESAKNAIEGISVKLDDYQKKIVELSSTPLKINAETALADIDGILNQMDELGKIAGEGKKVTVEFTGKASAEEGLQAKIEKLDGMLQNFKEAAERMTPTVKIKFETDTGETVYDAIKEIEEKVSTIKDLKVGGESGETKMPDNYSAKLEEQMSVASAAADVLSQKLEVVASKSVLLKEVAIDGVMGTIAGSLLAVPHPATMAAGALLTFFSAYNTAKDVKDLVVNFKGRGSAESFLSEKIEEMSGKIQDFSSAVGQTELSPVVNFEQLSESVEKLKGSVKELTLPEKTIVDQLYAIEGAIFTVNNDLVSGLDVSKSSEKLISDIQSIKDNLGKLNEGEIKSSWTELTGEYEKAIENLKNNVANESLPLPPLVLESEDGKSVKILTQETIDEIRKIEANFKTAIPVTVEFTGRGSSETSLSEKIEEMSDLVDGFEDGLEKNAAKEIVEFEGRYAGQISDLSNALTHAEIALDQFAEHANALKVFVPVKFESVADKGIKAVGSIAEVSGAISASLTHSSHMVKAMEQIGSAFGENAGKFAATFGKWVVVAKAGVEGTDALINGYSRSLEKAISSSEAFSDRCSSLSENLGVFSDNISSLGINSDIDDIRDAFKEFEEVSEGAMPGIAYQLKEMTGVSNILTVSAEQLSTSLRKLSEQKFTDSIAADASAIKNTFELINYKSVFGMDMVKNFFGFETGIKTLADVLASKTNPTVQKYNGIISTTVDRLTELATKFGWTKEKITEYVSALDLNPEASTKITSEVLKSLKELEDYTAKMSPKVEVEFTGRGSSEKPLSEKVDEMSDKVAKFGKDAKEDGSVKVESDFTDVSEDLKELAAQARVAAKENQSLKKILSTTKDTSGEQDGIADKIRANNEIILAAEDAKNAKILQDDERVKEIRLNAEAAFETDIEKLKTQASKQSLAKTQEDIIKELRQIRVAEEEKLKVAIDAEKKVDDERDGFWLKNYRRIQKTMAAYTGYGGLFKGSLAQETADWVRHHAILKDNSQQNALLMEKIQIVHNEQTILNEKGFNVSLSGVQLQRIESTRKVFSEIFKLTGDSSLLEKIKEDNTKLLMAEEAKDAELLGDAEMAHRKYLAQQKLFNEEILNSQMEAVKKQIEQSKKLSEVTGQGSAGKNIQRVREQYKKLAELDIESKRSLFKSDQDFAKYKADALIFAYAKADQIATAEIKKSSDYWKKIVGDSAEDMKGLSEEAAKFITDISDKSEAQSSKKMMKELKGLSDTDKIQEVLVKYKIVDASDEEDEEMLNDLKNLTDEGKIKQVFVDAQIDLSGEESKDIFKELRKLDTDKQAKTVKVRLLSEGDNKEKISLGLAEAEEAALKLEKAQEKLNKAWESGILDGFTEKLAQLTHSTEDGESSFDRLSHKISNFGIMMESAGEIVGQFETGFDITKTITSAWAAKTAYSENVDSALTDLIATTIELPTAVGKALDATNEQFQNATNYVATFFKDPGYIAAFATSIGIAAQNTNDFVQGGLSKASPILETISKNVKEVGIHWSYWMRAIAATGDTLGATIKSASFLTFLKNEAAALPRLWTEATAGVKLFLAMLAKTPVIGEFFSFLGKGLTLFGKALKLAGRGLDIFFGEFFNKGITNLDAAGNAIHETFTGKMAKFGTFVAGKFKAGSLWVVNKLAQLGMFIANWFKGLAPVKFLAPLVDKIVRVFSFMKGKVVRIIEVIAPIIRTVASTVFSHLAPVFMFIVSWVGRIISIWGIIDSFIQGWKIGRWLGNLQIGLTSVDHIVQAFMGNLEILWIKMKIGWEIAKISWQELINTITDTAKYIPWIGKWIADKLKFDLKDNKDQIAGYRNQIAGIRDLQKELLTTTGKQVVGRGEIAIQNEAIMKTKERFAVTTQLAMEEIDNSNQAIKNKHLELKATEFVEKKKSEIEKKIAQETALFLEAERKERPKAEQEVKKTFAKKVDDADKKDGTLLSEREKNLKVEALYKEHLDKKKEAHKKEIEKRVNSEYEAAYKSSEAGQIEALNAEKTFKKITADSIAETIERIAKKRALEQEGLDKTAEDAKKQMEEQQALYDATGDEDYLEKKEKLNQKIIDAEAHKLETELQLNMKSAKEVATRVGIFMLQKKHEYNAKQLEAAAKAASEENEALKQAYAESGDDEAIAKIQKNNKKILDAEEAKNKAILVKNAKSQEELGAVNGIAANTRRTKEKKLNEDLVEIVRSGMAEYIKAVQEKTATLWDNVGKGDKIKGLTDSLTEVGRGYQEQIDLIDKYNVESDSKRVDRTRAIEAEIAGIRISQVRTATTETLSMIDAQAEKERSKVEGNEDTLRKINQETLTKKKEYYKKAKESLDSELKGSLDRERSYADEIRALHKMLADEKKKDADFELGLSRAKMSEDELFNSKMEEAQKKLAKAREVEKTDAKAANALYAEAKESIRAVVAEQTAQGQIYSQNGKHAAEATKLLNEAQDGLVSNSKKIEETAKEGQAKEKARIEETKSSIQTLSDELKKIQEMEAISLDMKINKDEVEAEIQSLKDNAPKWEATGKSIGEQISKGMAQSLNMDKMISGQGSQENWEKRAVSEKPADTNALKKQKEDLDKQIADAQAKLKKFADTKQFEFAVTSTVEFKGDSGEGEEDIEDAADGAEEAVEGVKEAADKMAAAPIAPKVDEAAVARVKTLTQEINKEGTSITGSLVSLGLTGTVAINRLVKSMSGMGMLSWVKEVQSVSKANGVLTASTQSLAGAFSAVAAVAGAFFVGWKIGEWLNTFPEVQEVAQKMFAAMDMGITSLKIKWLQVKKFFTSDEDKIKAIDEQIAKEKEHTASINETIKTIESAKDKDLKVNVKFTGTGSDEKPLSEKTEEMGKDIEEFADGVEKEEPEVTVAFKDDKGKPLSEGVFNAQSKIEKLAVAARQTKIEIPLTVKAEGASKGTGFIDKLKESMKSHNFGEKISKEYEKVYANLDSQRKIDFKKQFEDTEKQIIEYKKAAKDIEITESEQAANVARIRSEALAGFKENSRAQMLEQRKAGVEGVAKVIEREVKLIQEGSQKKVDALESDIKKLELLQIESDTKFFESQAEAAKNSQMKGKSADFLGLNKSIGIQSEMSAKELELAKATHAEKAKLWQDAYGAETAAAKRKSQDISKLSVDELESYKTTAQKIWEIQLKASNEKHEADKQALAITGVRLDQWAEKEKAAIGAVLGIKKEAVTQEVAVKKQSLSEQERLEAEHSILVADTYAKNQQKKQDALKAGDTATAQSLDKSLANLTSYNGTVEQIEQKAGEARKKLAEDGANAVAAASQKELSVKKEVVSEQKVLDLELAIDREKFWKMNPESAKAHGKDMVQIEKESAEAQIEIARLAQERKAEIDAKSSEGKKSALASGTEAEKQAAEEYKNIDKATLEKRLEGLKTFEQATKERLNTQIELQKQAAEKIKALTQGIADQKKSYASDMREIDRQGMTDSQANADKWAEAQEKIAQATAMGNDRLEEKQKLLQEAYDQAKGLSNVEIKDGDRVLVSKAESAAKAKAMMDEAHKQKLAIMEAQKKLEEENLKKAKESIQTLTDSMEGAKKQIEVIGGLLGADVKKGLEEAAVEAKKLLDELGKKATIDIDTSLANKKLDELIAKQAKLNSQKASASSGSSGGGDAPVAMATGGHVPGMGTGDIVPAMLTPGEHVQPVSSVQKYGLRFFEMLRHKIIPTETVDFVMQSGLQRLRGIKERFSNITFSVPEMRLPAFPAFRPQMVQAFAQGGPVFNSNGATPQNMGSLTLNLGGVSGEVHGETKFIKALMEQVKKEQSMGYGRSKR